MDMNRLREGDYSSSSQVQSSYLKVKFILASSERKWVWFVL